MDKTTTATETAIIIVMTTMVLNRDNKTIITNKNLITQMRNKKKTQMVKISLKNKDDLSSKSSTNAKRMFH